MAEFYKHVPKELAANLQYRLDLRRRARDDTRFQAIMLEACRTDVLFFLNAFAWLYEPRPKKDAHGKTLPNIIPFITWPHQDPAIIEIREALGFQDIGVEKSRGEGASWIAVWLAIQDWLFKPMTAIGLVSRTEDAVDSADDPDSLMWKIDWGVEKLPAWMKPRSKRNQDKHNKKNLDNNSTITGYAATGDVGSGGRKAWFLMDELAKFPRGPDEDAMASTQPVTNSRFFVSTPKGAEGAYYRLMHEPSTAVRITLDWTQNPTRNRGLYRLVDGKPVAVDPVNNPLLPAYNPPTAETINLFSKLRAKGFVLEGRVRSPWYDEECGRASSPQHIAQEYDRNYGGAMYRVLGDDFDNQVRQTVTPPYAEGKITYHPETLEPSFDLCKEGPIKLWMKLDHRGRPPLHQFVVSADVSTGLGGVATSNSVVEAIDATTMEQVLEFASNTIPPSDWADHCIAISKWLNNAYLAWEVQGPGFAFTQRVKDMGYHNVYYRKLGGKRGVNRTKELGWSTTPKSKEELFAELDRSVRSGELKIRSTALATECVQYVRMMGKITHHASSKSVNDAVRGEAHGDRVIALGVGLMAVRDRPALTFSTPEASSLNDPPPGTMEYRQKMWEESQRATEEEWDDRTNYDLATGLTSSR